MKAKYVELVKGIGMQDAGMKCAICCGMIAYGDDCVAVEGLSGYGVRNTYFHPHCFNRNEYHEHTEVNRTGTMNYTDWRKGDISIELEAISTDYSSWNRAIFGDEMHEADEEYLKIYVTTLMLGSKEAGHGQTIERDCTVLHEGHSRGQDLYSFSKWVHEKSEEELDCLRDDRCGMHMHVNCPYVDLFNDNAKYGNDTQRAIRYALWHPFLMRVRAMSDEEHIEYFGRTFTHYARNDKGQHGDAINLATGYNTVEFRLPHFRTADQIVKCAKMWRDVVNKINIYCEKHNGTIATVHEAEKVGKQMARCIDTMMYGIKYNKGR